MPRKEETWEEVVLRFWAQVAVCAHGLTCRRCCWEWQGQRNSRGYGVMVLPFPLSPTTAHRFAHELAHGAMWLVPCTPRYAIFLATHTCDNPPCCNSCHVAAGTPGDNMRDAARKGILSHPWKPGRTIRKYP